MATARRPSARDRAEAPSPEDFAAWQARRFSRIRSAEVETPVDDELPVDALADLDATRAALRRLDAR